jgi:hypothetical protein
MKRRLLAWWGKICPFCVVGRRKPESRIGRKVVEHWEQGCPVRQAYLEVFGEGERRSGTASQTDRP